MHLHKDTIKQFRFVCTRKNLEKVQSMVRRGIDVNTRFIDGHTPLTLVIKDYTKQIHFSIDWCVPFLLEHGADPKLSYNPIEYILEDPMHYPIDAIQILLQAGASWPPNALQKLLFYNVPDLIRMAPNADIIPYLSEALQSDHHDIWVVDWAHHHGVQFHDLYKDNLTWLEWMCELLSYTQLTIWGWQPERPISSIHGVYKNECDTFRGRYGGYSLCDEYETEVSRKTITNGRFFPPCRWEWLDGPTESTDQIYSRRIQHMVHLQGVRPRTHISDSLLVMVRTGLTTSKRDAVRFLWKHGYCEYARQADFRALMNVG